MKIVVLAKPNKRETKITKLDEGIFEVLVTEAAVGNKANKAIITSLSRYFNVPKSSVEIVRGERGKQKVVEISI